METFCASAPRSKHRAALTSSSFYQSSPYGRNLRQNDYSLPSRSHQSTMLWHHRTQQNIEKPKSKVTSVALAGAAFLVFIAVLSIAGLALYMGVLRTEAPTQLLTYNCSAKILRGDRFLNNLQEKARKYKQQLEILYHRSSVGPALVSCTVERFGDDSVTIYFRISLNRKALPRSISNLEKTLKEILLNDSMSRRPVFRNVRYDPRSVQIRQVLDNNTLYDKAITKLKETVKPKPGVLLKPNYKQNTNLTQIPAKKQPDQTVVKNELSVLQGSFEISKTEADITAKKDTTRITTTVKSSDKTTAKTTPKGAYVTSNFYKIATVNNEVEKSTPSSSKTKSTTLVTTTTTTKVSSVLTTSTITKALATTTTTTKKPNNHFFFTIPSHSIDQEPWVPIQGTTETSQYKHKPSLNLDSRVSEPRIDNVQAKHPIYTSFTNPGLSFYSTNLEKLGPSSIIGHPLPVDKIETFSETPSSSDQFEKLGYDISLNAEIKNLDLDEDMEVSADQSETFVEVETLKHVPGTTGFNLEEETGSTTKLNWELLNGTTIDASVDVFNQSDNTLRKYSIKDQLLKINDSTLLANISSIFRNLASSLGVLPKSIITTTTSIPSTELPILTDGIEVKEKVDGITEESGLGEGHAEVVEVDEDLIMSEIHASTKLPLVTLIPVKSNSGVGRPLRPRPHKPTNTTDLVENRSFPSSSFIKNLNNDFSAPIKFVHTEVVTSVSTEINRVKINKNRLNDYKVLGVLNFETEGDKSESTTPFVKEHIIYKKSNTDNDTEINRNPKRGSKETILNEETSVYSVNSSVSISKGNIHFNVLTEDKLKQLSEISKIHANLSTRENEPIISNKAISASYTNNQAGFKILTKTLNKIPTFIKEDQKSGYGLNAIVIGDGVANKTDCSNYTIKCGDGQCLPDTTRCNQLVDCSDGTDEKNCNCADYLKSQYLLRKICDGVVDCWDFSDENLCEWCNPGQYVCSNSKFCINKSKICDGIRDCPNGDDETQCVTVAPNVKAADEYPYYSEGYLLVRKNGQWGKLCLEPNLEQISPWKISDLGKAVCKSRTYQKLDIIDITNDSIVSYNEENRKYFEVSRQLFNITKGNLSFEESSCDGRNLVKLRCHALECGTRPQAVNQLARRMYRIVGGGNAGLGAWPWQAALYKEGEFQCGATLLTDRWLLSAGHCFFHSLEDHWVARMGALRRGTALPSPYEQLRPIIQIILHPGYVDVGFVNDISLLQMETPVVFSDYVRPICLPTPDSVLKDNRICTVIGWGQLFEVGRIFPDTLQEVQVPVISTAECRKHTLFLPLYKITDDMFCAGYDRGGRDACLGDSGGPLMCSEPDGRWVLYGITSNGYGCARANRPGVYTKVANYLTYIQSHISDNNKNSNKVVKTVCHGHRCPLGECLPKSRLCNGYIECSDGSDEKNCPELL